MWLLRNMVIQAPGFYSKHKDCSLLVAVKDIRRKVSVHLEGRSIRFRQSLEACKLHGNASVPRRNYLEEMKNGEPYTYTCIYKYTHT